MAGRTISDQGLGQFLGTGRFKQNLKKLKEMIWLNIVLLFQLNDLVVSVNILMAV